MSTTIEFHFRPSRREKRSAGSVFVRVIRKRSGRSLTLPLKIYPDEWDHAEHRVAFPSENKNRFPYLWKAEHEIERVRFMLSERISKLEAAGHPFSSADVLRACRRGGKSSLLFAFTRKLARELSAAGRERTARGYMTTVRRLIAFTGNRETSIAAITPHLMQRFEYCLRSEGKALNTVSFYMRNLRAIYNKAVKEGKLDPFAHDPFEDVYTGICVTKKRALTKEQMAMLQNWTVPLNHHHMRTCNKSSVSAGANFNSEVDSKVPLSGELRRDVFRGADLIQAQQLFLFGFHARGMSFVDMAFLRKEDIREGVLRYRRKKTGRPLEMKVSQDMARIIRFFEKETASSPYVFPLIRRPGENERLQYESALRTQNNRLKRLAFQLITENAQWRVEEKTKRVDTCSSYCQLSAFNRRPGLAVGKRKESIHKNNSQLSTLNFQLSTHVSRHSWATIARRERVPLVVISEGLGHTSEKTTAVYLASFDRKVLDRAAQKVSAAVKTTG